MQELRQQFESQLRTKLSQKASVHHTETQLLLEAFRYFDLDNSGVVDFSEWTQVCDRLNLRVPRKSSEQLFNYYDFDSSGSLDYKEFSALVLGKTREQVEAEVYASTGSGRMIGASAKLGSRGRPENTTDQHRTTTITSIEAVEAEPTVRSVNIEKSLDSFRRKLLDRGVQGLLQLTETFRRLDTDRSNSLNLDEFAAACVDLRLNLSKVETQALFRLFDSDGSGSIDYKEFCRAVRGPMNSFKKQLVLALWDHLDRSRQNRIDLEIMIEKYDSRNHPEVKQGRATPREVSAEFSSSARVHHTAYGSPTQFVSKEEFIDLYNHFAAVYPDDRLFELTLAACWNLPSTRPRSDNWEGARSARGFSKGTGAWAEQMHGTRPEEPEVAPAKPDGRIQASSSEKPAGAPTLFSRAVYRRN